MTEARYERAPGDRPSREMHASAPSELLVYTIGLVVAIVLTCVLALGSFGNTLAQGLPLWALVGYQGFRVVVELMLHRAYEQGVIGVQMTWSGRNFDVLSGASALSARPIPHCALSIE